jgi:ferredoxin-NADP reductase
MIKRLHPVAGVLALATITTFWLSTAISELFGSPTLVTAIKTAIPWGFLLLIPALAAAGGSGFTLAKGWQGGLVGAKIKRMPLIAANGILVFIPCALFLASKAKAAEFDAVFYAVQVLEIVAGGTNIALLGLNMRDGLKLTGRLRHRAVELTLLAKDRLVGTDMMTFRLERGQLEYTAGQYAFFKLDDVAGDPKGQARCFSLASSPTEQTAIMISTRVGSSPYKQKLASLEKGAHILAWEPGGEFVLHDDYSKPAILLSGGIGVTPFRSMIKYATDGGLPLKIVVFDSNSDESHILYREEFDRWSQENKNLTVIHTLTHEARSEWKGERGRIDKAMITRYAGDISRAIFYVCGPPGMVQTMQDLLRDEMHLPKDRIKTEHFIGY